MANRTIRSTSITNTDYSYKLIFLVYTDEGSGILSESSNAIFHLDMTFCFDEKKQSEKELESDKILKFRNFLTNNINKAKISFEMNGISSQSIGFIPNYNSNLTDSEVKLLSKTISYSFNGVNNTLTDSKLVNVLIKNYEFYNNTGNIVSINGIKIMSCNVGLTPPVYDMPMNNGKYCQSHKENGILINDIIIPNVRIPSDGTHDGIQNIAYCEISTDNQITWTKLNYYNEILTNEKYVIEKDENGEIILDENNNPVYKLDENGNKILESPAVYVSGFKNEDISFGDIGTYELYFRYVMINDPNISAITEKISFEIIEYRDITPIVMIATESDPDNYRPLINDEQFNEPVYIDYQEKPNIDDVIIIVDETPIERKNMISSNGNHTIYMITTSYIVPPPTDEKEEDNSSSISEETNMKFSISKILPAPIEVEGVSDEDVGTSFDISIKIENETNITVYYYPIADPTNKIVPTLRRETREDNNVWLCFTLDTEGIFNITITATNINNNLSRVLNITNITIDYGAVSDEGTLVQFNPQDPSVHSTRMELRTDSTKSKLTYWLKEREGDGFRYLSPILIFENLIGYGQEVNGKKSVNANKSFRGITSYIPEVPLIIGVEPEVTYYKTPVSFKFKNLASKPDRARYFIFVDGHYIKTPFSGSHSVTQYGTHFIFILGWDNIYPTECTFYTMKFMVHSEEKDNIRNPFIQTDQNPGDQKVNITVNFSKVHEDVKHVLEIRYPDETIDRREYPWNIGIVKITVYKNCVVDAYTQYLHDKNSTKKDSVVIDSIFEGKASLNDIKILGLTDKTIHVNGASGITGNFKLKIGPCAIIDFGKEWNYQYEIYLNGKPYNPYAKMIASGMEDDYHGKDAWYPPIIENSCHEIRKYRLELVSKNAWHPDDDTLKSYFYTEFIIDSLELPFPKLGNLNENIMSRQSLPKTVVTKDEPEGDTHSVFLNNLSKPVDTVTRILLTKDDEYILTITYTYYNGRKRTSTFCFSMNSNIIDELTPHRLIIKVKDFQDIPDYDWYVENGIEPEPHEGEFIIDRCTGNLYYGSKTGTEKAKVKPITKNIESVLIESESYLLMSDKSFTKLEYYRDTCNQLLSYYLKKMDDFMKRLKYYEDLLNNICDKLDKIERDLNKLIEEMNFFESTMNSRTDLVTGQIAAEIQALLEASSKLNSDFLKMVNDLNENIFPSAALINDDVYRQQVAIKKKITREKFEAFKTKELNKLEKFRKNAEKYGDKVNG